MGNKLYELKPASQNNSGRFFKKSTYIFIKTPMNFLKVTHNKDKKCHLILGTKQAVYYVNCDANMMEHLNAGCIGQNYQQPQLLRHMKVKPAATIIGRLME